MFRLAEGQAQPCLAETANLLHNQQAASWIKRGGGRRTQGEGQGDWILICQFQAGALQGEAELQEGQLID